MSTSAIAEDHEMCSSPVAERSASSSQSPDISIGNSQDVQTPDLSQYPRPADYDTWMPCKKQAWDQIQTNPNAFFYRHVLPNEEKKNGPWSHEETLLFIDALRKQPVGNTHWGLFARNIPGRVGYQCNAYYKKLIASGDLQRLAPDIPIPAPKPADENGKPKEGSPKRRKAEKVSSPKRDSNSANCNLEYHSINQIVVPRLPDEDNSFKEKLRLFSHNQDMKNAFLKDAQIFF